MNLQDKNEAVNQYLNYLLKTALERTRSTTEITSTVYNYQIAISNSTRN